MKQMIKILIYFLAGIMAVSGISDAAVINGGFEEGTLNGWTPNGGVNVIPSGGMGYFDETLQSDIPLDAPEGSKFVLLSTGPSSNGGIDMDGNGDPDFDIANLSQTFTLDANQVPAVISFKWSFLTSEVSFGGFLQDDFFQVKLTKNSNIETVFLKGSVPGSGQSTSGFPDVGILDGFPWMVSGGESFVDGKTDFQTSYYQINEPGEYTLQFLVADQADVDTNSGLIIDNVTLTTLVNPGLQGVGPISGANGFPIWYEDSNGLRLEPCLSGPNGFDPNCALLADPGFNPSQPIVFPTNFPEEMFYWSADGSMDIGADTGSAGRARLVLALEGAFTNGPVAVGEQAVFGRVRIVMDAPAAGIYTVTHPYGVDVFNVTEPGPRAVFYTQDHGCFGLADYPCNFAIPLSSRIGPFLTSVDNPPPPAGYIGGDTPSNVTGSPFNTNFFRIDGPAGVDLDPVLPGVQTTITTNLFILTGRLFSGSANITGLKINDKNSNGILDTGEGLVPGWKVTVSNDTRGFIANTITDSSGLYRLLNIPNGTYNVSEEVIAGWENTTPISNVITVANTESAMVNFTNRFLADHGVSMVVDESSTSSRLTQPNINATYVITVTNIGHFPDTFDLSIQNPQGAAAALDIPVITLAPGMSGTVLLNVTSGGQGNFNVNVTATSQTDANATTTLGTTTRVTGLQAVGPVDTSNGFPGWYLDTKGLPLEPCLAGPDGLADTNCALLADPGFNLSEPIVFPTNFPEEMFYWSADGSMDIGADTGSAGRARLVLAMEGAFTNGPVAVNEQAVFGRVRIVMDAPEAGIYTVTHPYGVDVFNVTEPGPRAVFYTQDHGCFGLADSLCNFAIPLSSRIGPFLTSVDDPPPPAGYIGDGATPSNVTGSPFNTNFFRIDGPAGVDLDPVLPGVQTTITTNLFVLTGKILQDAANITGFKINDSNNNGISDQGESGVAGWNISVKNPVTGQVNNTITDANGFYQFLNLVPGNYIVTEEANASWMNSNATSKTINLNGIDSINNNFTYPLHKPW
ncbi:MAG: SdrD B-like domain-containing protein [Candidatus Methanoperedens sp.]